MMQCKGTLSKSKMAFLHIFSVGQLIIVSLRLYNDTCSLSSPSFPVRQLDPYFPAPRSQCCDESSLQEGHVVVFTGHGKSIGAGHCVIFSPLQGSEEHMDLDQALRACHGLPFLWMRSFDFGWPFFWGGREGRR